MLKFKCIQFQDQKIGPGRPLHDEKMVVFHELVLFLQQEVFKTTFTLGDVFDKMIKIAGDREYYTEKSLRKKLKEEFGGSLQFVNIGSRSDILCFKSDADRIITEYHAAASTDDGVEPKKKFLQAAAKLLLDEAKCVRDLPTDRYPDLNDLDKPDPCVPEAFRWFFEALLPQRLAEIWSQCLLRKVLPRAPVSPFQLGNALFLKHKWNSKLLNEHMWKLGFAGSYKEYRNYLWSWLATEINKEPNAEQLLIQYVCDNLDLAMCSSNKVISVHGTATIKVYPDKKEDADTETQVIRRPVLAEEKDKILDKLKPSMEPYHYNKANAALGRLKFVPLNELSYGVDTITEFHQRDLEWLGKDLSSGWCNWSGYQATEVNLEPGNGNNRVSCIEYMPLINQNPTEYTTLHTLIRNLIKDAEGEPIIVTFDYPLYIKVVEIVETLNLKALVRLGGFHTIRSYLGCIGNVMKGSGLETMVAILYPGENTVEHIMSGNAYYKALRCHFLIVKGLFIASGEQCFDRATLDELRSRGRTASLWVTYIEMVMLLFSFIRAERLGDISLHLQTLRSMLPYFVAGGHHQYAKGIWLSLQLFDTWQEKYPDLVREFFFSAIHTVRYSDLNWCGTWSDMSIEETVNRDAKSSGGLTHGTLRNIETMLITWFSFTQCTSAVSGKLQSVIDSLSRSHSTTTYAHPDTKPAAKNRDTSAVKQISELVVDWSPFDPDRNPDELLSLSTGLKDKDRICNPECAREFGESFLPELDQMPYLTTIPRSKKIVSLTALKPCVRIGSLAIGQDQIDPLRLFHRKLLIGSREISVEYCLEFELTPYPMSLFDINGFMRPRNKSAFVVRGNSRETGKKFLTS